MNNKNYIIAGLVGAVVILAGIYIIGFFTPVSVTPNPSSVPNVDIGAIPGDSIPGNYFSVGGVKYYSVRGNMKSASSTACSMLAPANATSTLINASANFTTGSATAVVIGFAKASSFAASSTKIGTDYALTAGAKVTLTASSSPGVAGLTYTFRPGSDGPDKYLNVYFWSASEGSSYTLSAPKGSCTALFKIDS